LALVAAAFVRSAPAPSLTGSGLPESVVAALDDPLTVVEVEVLFDEERFTAWTTNTGVQRCLHVAITTADPVRSIGTTHRDDVSVGTVCGPPGVAPTDSLVLSRTVSDAELRFGVAVGTVPSDYSATEWEVVADPEPSRAITRGDAFALVFRGARWKAAASGVGIEVVCACGGFTSNVRLTAGS
jgi:hypothetical protein